MRRRCIKSNTLRMVSYTYSNASLVWHSLNVFADLPKSEAEASMHYESQGGDSKLRLFWEHFKTLEEPFLVFG